MKARRLGSLEVPTLGYGAMVLSPGMYGPIDDDTGIAALRHVVERGAGFVDTSDAYGHESHNEILIGRALKGRRDDVVVATKFGFRFPAAATPHLVATGYTRRRVVVNTEPRYVRRYALASLRRLGIDCIDLWYPHFPDPEVPIEDTVGAMGEVVTGTGRARRAVQRDRGALAPCPGGSPGGRRAGRVVAVEAGRPGAVVRRR